MRNRKQLEKLNEQINNPAPLKLPFDLNSGHPTHWEENRLVAIKILFPDIAQRGSEYRDQCQAEFDRQFPRK